MTEKNVTSLSIAEEFQSKIKEDNRKAKIIQWAPAIILAALIIFFGITAQGFISITNLGNILNQLATPLIVSLGLTFVIIMGSIDLSVEGIMGMVGSIVSLLVLNNKTTMNLGILGIAISLMIGAFAGFITGTIHVKARIPSFMVSFGMSSIGAGIGLLSYGAIPATIQDPIFLTISSGSFLGIPLITWMAVVVLLIAYVLQEYTSFGRYVFAIGQNESILKSVGINVDRVKILVFIWSGFCVGLAGIIGAARLMRGVVLVGSNSLFPSITAVVVGGTALTGGKGGVLNTLLGAFIVTVLQNGLILIGVNPYIQTGINGMIIVAAVALSVAHGKKVIIK